MIGPVGDAQSVPALIDRSAVDAALLDINLGAGPSFEVAELLRERDIPFAFVTGYDGGVVPAEYSSARRIAKPVRDRDLVEAVSRLLAR